MKTISFIIVSLFLFFSCVPEEVTETDFAIPLKWSHISGSSEWDTYLRKALEDHGQELIDSTPTDIANFSTNYSTMNYDEKLNFWAYLISIMAERESSFKPETMYTESFNDGSGNPVISRGLLQLSIESAKGYQCPLTSAQQLHDPETNLTCAVFILKRWVVQDGLISGRLATGQWRGGARYWSVLRKESTLSFFTQHTLELF